MLEKALRTVPEERRMDYVGDYADALRHLGRIEEAEAALLPWGTNANPRVRAVAGDRLVAFYRATAKRYYVRPAAENSWNRYASALYATGRYEECLAIIPRLAKWCSLADRNKLYERILRERISDVRPQMPGACGTR